MALHQVSTTTAEDSSPFDDDTITQAPVVKTVTESLPVVQTPNHFENLAVKGFVGMKDDWRSSPMIALKTDGIFEDATGESYGKEFLGSCIGGRPKYAYSFAGSTDPKNELIYSYDRVTSTKTRQDGSYVTVAEFDAELRAKGKEMACKEYYEVDIILSAPGTPLDGESRKISVAPSSTSAYFSHMKKMERFGLVYTNLTRFKVGDKVKFGNAPAFYPWAFEIVTN